MKQRKNRKSDAGSSGIHSRFGNIRILFEDRDIIAVDKPAGLLSIATAKDEEQTLYRLINRYLKQKRKQERIFIVHRLDRDTSGVVLFAKSFKVKEKLQDSWKTAVFDKLYLAVVEGSVNDNKKEIRSFLAENKAFRVYSTQDRTEGKEAITRFECVSRNRDYSLLKIRLDTGRKNQIRVQLADYGHPVAGDKKYGAKTNPLHRLCLHATELSFAHPVTGEKISLASPPPQGFMRLVRMNLSAKQ
jgi:23S rRNA pseudouridine1911/1915/1917 synthase